jgi:HK97 family phage major capsid protein
VSFNITQIEQRVAQLQQFRADAETGHNSILEKCLRENRASTQEEATALIDFRKQVDDFKAEIANFEKTLTDLRAAEAAEGQASIGATDERRDAAGEVAKGAVRVGREPLTYERHDQRSSYLIDLVAAETGYGRVPKDEARARLEKHATEMRVEAPKFEARMFGTRGNPKAGEVDGNEVRYDMERRDLNRTDTTGGYFIPPIWMMSDYIDLARAGRVTANLCASMALPGGTDSINIPKISTGTATAIQTADNAAVTETDLADTSVTAGVKTIAGQQDISLQALEQSPLAFDQIILADLAGAHATNVDTQVISGSNASGQVLGIRTISSVDTTAYTDGSPTVAELYPKLADSWQQINTTRYLPPEAIIMHPRRWAWIMAALDSASRPFAVFQAQGPQNAPYIAGANAAEGFVGTSPFGPIYVDPNIPTTVGGGTEDVILFVRPSEYYLWEGAVRTRVLTEVLSGNLTVRLQLYSFLAFMPHRRPESTSIVSGTGLAAPTF